MDAVPPARIPANKVTALPRERRRCRNAQTPAGMPARVAFFDCPLMKPVLRVRLAALPLALVAAYPCVHAQDASSTPSPTLEAITVTEERGVATPLVQKSTAGSRLELTPFETPASLAIVTGELIRALGTT
jgi:hypothetical protein